jgi:hypothetical protein
MLNQSGSTNSHSNDDASPDEAGYRAVRTGDSVTLENAQVEAINPSVQRDVERALWELRHKDE